MTKEQVVELTGRSVYSIWIGMAERHFEVMDPEASFALADNFVKELLKQNPEF